MSKNNKIVGIGETDPDFYLIILKKDQIGSFLEHINASKKLNLPLIVHTRSAEKTLEILRSSQ